MGRQRGGRTASGCGTAETCTSSSTPTRRGHGRRRAPAGHLRRTTGQLRAWSHGNHPAAARLAARHGFERVRDLWVMRRPATRAAARAGRPADPALPRRRRRRAAAGQRGGLRPPPRAGGAGRGRPRGPDGGAVVGPGRAAGRHRRRPDARLPLDQAARRPARRGLRRRHRPHRPGTRPRARPHPRRAAPPARPAGSRRCCSTSRRTTPPRWRRTGGSASPTRTSTPRDRRSR